MRSCRMLLLCCVAGYSLARAATTIYSIELTGGTSYGGTDSSFVYNGNVWTAPGFWVLGLSKAGNPNNPFVNPANGAALNLPPDTYYTYNKQGGSGDLGSVIRVTVDFTINGGDHVEQAYFQVGPLNTAAAWTRLGGSTNISVSSTGVTNAMRVGPTLTPDGTVNDVLQMTIADPQGGGGGGGGGTVSIVQGPVFTTSVANPNTQCPLPAPTATTFQATDPLDIVWMIVGPIGSPNTILARFSFNGQPLTQLDSTWSFGSSQNYSMCPNFSPQGRAGNWTLTLYLNGSTGPVIATIPFTVSGGTGGSGVAVGAGPVFTESVSNPDTACPTSAPTAIPTFYANDPRATIWLGFTGLTPQNSLVLRFSYNGAAQPSLDWPYAAGSFKAGFLYLLCPTLTSPNNKAGSWTLSAYVDGSSTPLTTIPFTISAGSSGGGGGGGGGGSCATSVTPIGQIVPAAGGGPYTVVVTSSCAWTAVPGDSWMQVTSGASGNGNGTVTFNVSAYTGPPRVSSISIGTSSAWVYQNGTPTGTTPGCVYVPQGGTIFNIGVNGTDSGGPARFNTGQGCQWTASILYPPVIPTGWLTLIPPSSGANNGAVAFSVASNAGGTPRSASIVIAGQHWVVNQDGGGSQPGTPFITSGGVTNAASYAPAGPPNGIARGSYFSIFGTSLGPDPFVQATSTPLPTILANTTVQIVQGGNTYQAFIVFVSSAQINAILPSNVPTGSAQVVVTYNGKSSAPLPIVVSTTSFGVFFQAVNGNNIAIAQNYANGAYPLNTPSKPSQPGDIEIIWGTGLGAALGPDNVAPGNNARDLTNVNVTITVGGVPANRRYAGRQSQSAGVDNIYFDVPQLPANRYGCQVPVAITAGGISANVANIAITPNGAPCQ